ncbi:CRISPR-associated helicase/endonuclease Cas3 [Nocardia miyunensis]|uniref:CRISPR-associated helicase/endonuclease Cas3 n=1 Tax=Nocardia miyunensis TaxID=282684 RepID=UPI000A022CFF|nr:CRISPR-associated helicase/endonuclease Cas3 [Nocardia miyunensis]
MNSAGTRDRLSDHLEGTARRAGDFAEVFGGREVAEYFGRVHDVGKGRCAWQDGLDRADKCGGRVVDQHGKSIDHKLAGTWLAARHAGLGYFAMAVLGHHGGLGDRQSLKQAIARAEGTARDAVQEAISRVAALVPAIMPRQSPAVPDRILHALDPCVGELWLRMVFSALVDADFLDTAQHFTGVPRVTPPSLSGMAEVFEANRRTLLADAGVAGAKVNVIREQVYRQAVAAASARRGIFPFPAPTGVGKTIAAGGFAVHHAARHNLSRVIIAVPFLSITEQNAAVYRGLFGAENVLEHHSGVDLDDLPAEHRWQRLAAENWDAPVVVTTTVRLFESLFSRKPAAMRKLHRLAGAVIVLDEVQSLPDELLVPILSALRHLSEHFGTSVLLASATQPEFFSLKVFQDLKPRPVITEPQPLYDSLRRVRFEWRCDPKPTFERIAHEVAAAHQVLLVVNTTRDAGVLHTAIEHGRRCGGPVFHLSTRMAGAHRRDTLERIRRLLADELPVAVVSTQLVEAGVDVDFPLVYRAFAPAEALLQAAGRCNRNGLLDEGVVVVFDPADGSVRGTRMVYGAALDATRSYFGPGRDPDRLDLLTAYYNTRYAVKNIDNASLGTRIQKLRADFDFIKVAELFTMIEEGTVPVLVPYGDEVEREDLRSQLVGPDPVEPWVFRRLQPYLAALPKQLAARAVTDGYARVLLGDPATPHQARMYELISGYHDQRGIELKDLEPKEYVL